jgi:HlyD family type I secretion membrane fusion protein
MIHPNLAFLKPVNSDEFLPPIQLWVKLGGYFLVGTVGVAISLVSVTPFHVIVKAPAIVRPSGEIRIVQAATEGVVNQIAVQENQTVKLGDPIAYLDGSLFQTQKRQLQSNMQQSQQQLAQIIAQMRSLEEQQIAQSTAGERTIRSAEADLRRSQRDFSDRQVTTRTELQEANAELELAQEELKRYRQLGRMGAIPQLQIKVKEQAVKIALSHRVRARARVNPSNALVTIASEQIAQEKAQRSILLAKLRQERESLVIKKVEAENQFNRDRQALQQLDHDQQKSVLRATSPGIILKLALRNSGQVVHLGESIAEIAPSQSTLVIKARVAAQDIGGIKICEQKRPLDCQVGRVVLRISAYPYPDYGTLIGAVVAISPDATVPPSASSSASTSPSFEVSIQPEETFLSRGNRKYSLQSGMDATAEIITQEETVLTFMLRKAKLLVDP